MSISNEYTKHCVNNSLDMLNNILDAKLNTKEFINNQEVINKIGQIVKDTLLLTKGYVLFSITYRKNNTLFLITKSLDSSYFNIYSWIQNSSIDKVLSVKIHEKKIFDLDKFLDESNNKINLSESEIFENILVPTLNGYAINTNKIKDLQEFMKQPTAAITTNLSISQNNIEDSEYINLFTFIINSINNAKISTKNFIKNFSKKLKCPELEINVNDQVFSADKIIISKIIGIKGNLNTRYVQLRHYEFNPNLSIPKVTKSITKLSKKPTDSSFTYKIINDNYIIEKKSIGCRYISTDNFSRIPYNFMDIGRYIVQIYGKSDLDYDILISGDPKVNSEYVISFQETIQKFIDLKTKLKTNIDDTVIKVKNNQETKIVANIESYFDNQLYNDNDDNQESKSNNPLSTKLRALKKMVDEYNYISKKQKSIGKDINVTDKIKFNHTDGKVAYNNFSIAINDEMVKTLLYSLFEDYIVDFYRNKITEEDILNKIIDQIFHSLNYRLNSKSKDNFTIDMIINDKINIKIDSKLTKSNSRLFYINDQRFNKNELIVVLKEITCYQSQQEADLFIRNIGKVGLSVYIGVTSGFQYGERLYRFKKLDGRSNYHLVLDNIDVPIKGKKLISLLYENFIEKSHPAISRINQIVFECTSNTSDYMKFKFLIDSAYQSFIQRSKEYLNNKIKETDSKIVLYLNKNTYMDAVLVHGLSGKDYIISYDKTNSYVFMNSELLSTKKDNLEVYKNGKYICMIDQSNIKSNIGYDTIIAKIMALKNDSILAKNIYNLADELNITEEETNE